MAVDASYRRSILPALLLYCACLLAATLTEVLRIVPGSGISIWLPAGILLSAALASPLTKWPVWAAAAILAELTGNLIWYDHSILPALLLSFGNALAVMVGAYAIRFFVNDQQLFTTVRNTAIFIAVAGIGMPLMSATSGSYALGLSYGKPWSAEWARIFLGDATGAMVAAPLGLLLLNAAAPRLHVSTRRLREVSALAIIFAIFAGISLGGIVPFAYLMIPPLLWASLSFRIPGAIVAIVAVTLFAALFTLAGLGPFARSLMYIHYQNEALQLFLMVAATACLMMGAIAEENRRGIRDLHALNQTLEQRVAERSASLAATEAQAKQTANLLSAIGEACPDLIYAKDLNYAVIYANGATLRVLNAKSLDELKAAGEERMYARTDEFAPVHANDEKVLMTRQTIVEEEVVTDENGIRRVYRTTKSPLFDSEGELAGLAGISVDISDLIKSQAREKMLVREVEHRGRNLLAVVQGIVALMRADTVNELKDGLSKRIRALAQTNAVVTESNWVGADLEGILRNELTPYKRDDSAHIHLSGPSVILDPATAQSVTLIAHELTTNAAKYGSLSSANGQLEVIWSLMDTSNTEQLLELEWREQGGPTVTPPSRQGFGTTIIGVFGQEKAGSSVDFTWASDGLRLSLKLPLTRSKAAA